MGEFAVLVNLTRRHWTWRGLASLHWSWGIQASGALGKEVVSNRPRGHNSGGLWLAASLPEPQHSIATRRNNIPAFDCSYPCSFSCSKFSEVTVHYLALSLGLPRAPPHLRQRPLLQPLYLLLPAHQLITWPNTQRPVAEVLKLSQPLQNPSIYFHIEHSAIWKPPSNASIPILHHRRPSPAHTPNA
jgi:hypothetical protein